jgi:phosphoglycolate phosphatase
MQFSAALFDLDGTLLDTLEDIADAANAVLASQGMPTHPLAAYKLFVGQGVVRLFDKALPPDHRSVNVIARAHFALMRSTAAAGTPRRDPTTAFRRC